MHAAEDARPGRRSLAAGPRHGDAAVAADALYRVARLARDRASSRTTRSTAGRTPSPRRSSGRTCGERRGRRTVLIAPDSFKGSLTSVQVARALADGWRRARPDDTVLLCPLADGGEGTLEAIAAAGGWTWQDGDGPRPARAAGRGPLAAAPPTARGAVVEMAEASGLSRVAPDERDPIAATLRRDRRADPARRSTPASTSIVLGIGGSATTDGGAGCSRAGR